MTALDQAFIRAFSQQGTLPAVSPRQSAGNSPNSRVNEDGVAPCDAVAPKAEPQPSAVPCAPDVARPHISDVFRDVLATLERPPLRPTSPEKGRAPTTDGSWSSAADAGSGAWIADWCQTSVGMAEPLDLAEPIVLAESVGLAESVDEPEPRELSEPAGRREPAHTLDPVDAKDLGHGEARARARIEPPRQQEQREERTTIDNVQSAISDPRSAIGNQQSSVAPPDFKPAWQVERFTWPRVCRRLMARAAEEFDRLADALLAANARGQKVLAMAGCCRGEGATTLLLCAARQLAERGVKLVLVDADLAQPRLAKRLGVELQSGWNETSGEEATFLSNAIVESAANNLALSAIRQPADDPKRGDWSRLAPCLDTLRNHYEMVLVDLGPLESIESTGDLFERTVGGKIDAILLIRNPRITSEARLADVEAQLTASGVALAGLIENFVA